MSLIQSLAQIVGAANVIAGDDAARVQKYTDELRRRYRSECAAVVLPGSADEVAAVVRCCAAAGTSIVPQGGNTGTMGGAVARAGQVIVNLARMNRVLEVDAVNDTMRVQAGVILADVQAAAEAAGRFFPLSLGAQGSCQIGGNLATNAGGINVLQYGNARDLALGLEVVLADGRIWRGLNSLRKNNTGYDLKNLFIGSEGTLGIITAAVLKLYPRPKMRVVCLLGVRAPEDALALLGRLRDATSDRLTTFELMANLAVQSAVRYVPGQSDPFAAQHDWYALVVADSSAEDDDALPRSVEAALARAMEEGVLQDAVIAGNERQARQLILLREDIVEAQKFEGGSIKHDVAVAVAKVPEFIARATTAMLEALPDARPYVYGHMGDGNMHLNLSQPAGGDTAAFLGEWKRVNDIVHAIACDMDGSFSAEHGVGIAKLEEMRRYKDAVELELCGRVKGMLDPGGVFNPGKVVESVLR